MWRERNTARGGNAQTFLLEAEETLMQQPNIGLAGEPGEPALDGVFPAWDPRGARL
jgi:hypothetical protein